MKDKSLPTDAEVKKKFAELLDAKQYEKAAQLVVYFTFCKLDPDKFAQMLHDAAKQYIEERGG